MSTHLFPIPVYRGRFSLCARRDQRTAAEHPGFGMFGLSRFPRGRFAMRGTDLEAPITAGLHSAARLFPGFLRLALCAAVILACATFEAAQSTAQDVADAARQERARKEAQDKKPKHVYTEDDLKRAQILTPADRAELEAKKNEQPSPKAGKSEQALESLPSLPNVNSSALATNDFPKPLPSETPLGDVARYYKRWKTSQALRREQKFTLTLPNAPALASPKAMQPLDPSLLSAEPMRPRLNPSQPLAHPSRASRPALKLEPPQLTPFQPPVRRSPFARPKFFTTDPPRITSSHHAPPSLSTQPPASPTPAPKPAKTFVLANPSKPVAPAKPTVRLFRPSPSALVAPAPAIESLAPIVPVLPAAPHAAPIKPSVSASVAPLAFARPVALTVQPGDSLWKLAAKHLGRGLRWREFLAVNPGIRNANLIKAGAQILVPAAAPSPPTSRTITVQRGDTLSSIAQAYLGHALAWGCVAHANPSIVDPSLIYLGQKLLVPSSCNELASKP